MLLSFSRDVLVFLYIVLEDNLCTILISVPVTILDKLRFNVAVLNTPLDTTFDIVNSSG